MGHALVEIAGDEVEDVFLKIGPSAADAVNLVLANHFGQRDAKFRGAHGPSQCDEHLAARREKLVVTQRGVDQRGRVEVPVV